MITSAKYLENGYILSVIDGEEFFVPDDMSNRHRVMIAEWEAEGNAIEPYVAPPPPIPEEISRRQFFQQLAVMEIITRSEALAAMQGGAIPASLQAIIGALPTDDDKFQAQMLIAGASSFSRQHPLAETVRIAMDWTEDQRNDFWRDAYDL